LIIGIFIYRWWVNLNEKGTKVVSAVSVTRETDGGEAGDIQHEDQSAQFIGVVNNDPVSKNKVQVRSADIEPVFVYAREIHGNGPSFKDQVQDARPSKRPFSCMRRI
jgi:hypothetical protein